MRARFTVTARGSRTKRCPVGPPRTIAVSDDIGGTTATGGGAARYTVSMDDPEKRKGECEGCGKRPRVLRRIDSGQWLCQKCLREIRPPRPKHLATAKQLAYARALGFDVSDNATKEEVGELLGFHELVKYYVYDVWEELAGERPKNSGIPQTALTELVTGLVKDRSLACRISRVQAERDEKAYERTDALRDAAYRKLEEEYGGVDSERFQDKLDDALAPISLKANKPQAPRNADFKYVAKLLEAKFGSYMPKRGFLGRLMR
jgi:ribosomal protein L37AE/L43A